jgi:hypothetical protein
MVQTPLTADQLPIAVPSQAPAWEPISLGETKQHLGLATGLSGFDARLSGLITEARLWSEGMHKLRYAQDNMTWAMAWVHSTEDIAGVRFGFPPSGYQYSVRLPIVNTTAIANITYIDPDGAGQILDPATYVLKTDSVWPNVRLADPNGSWPDTMQGIPDAVLVTLTAGWATAADVPPSYKLCLAARVASQFYSDDPRYQDVSNNLAQQLQVY